MEKIVREKIIISDLEYEITEEILFALPNELSVGEIRNGMVPYRSGAAVAVYKLDYQLDENRFVYKFVGVRT